MEERNDQMQPPVPAVEPVGVPVEPSLPIPREAQPVNGLSPPAARPRAPRPGHARRPRIEKGSLRLFRLFGVDVFVHCTWFIAVYFQFRQRQAVEAKPPGWQYASPTPWYVAEILTLFLIVLLHEFGHALACRSVGGRAERIYLWPLGGVAFVNPPPRPGPFLWSIVAGPLVNVLLVPFSIGILLLAHAAGTYELCPDLWVFLKTMALVNGVLLFFNLLPIFPLDGGQILQGLLWFIIGQAWSLLVVTVLALPAAVLLGVLALGMGNYVLAVLCGLGLLVSLAGLVRARMLLRVLNAPRRPGFHCPACGAAQPVGEHWACKRCMMRYDPFARRWVCPRCGNHARQMVCADCLQSRPIAAWAPADRTAGPVPDPAAPRPVPPAG
jgi:Zn-dependent protease